MPHKTTDDIDGFTFAGGEHWIIDPQVLIFSTGTAVFSGSTGSRLTNHGIVFGSNWGVYFAGNTSVIENDADGLIKGSTAVFTGSGGLGTVITNKGTMFGTAEAGVDLGTGADNARLNNAGSGVIKGWSAGVTVSGEGVDVKNAGDIVGESGPAILVSAPGSAIVNKKGALLKGLGDALRSNESGQLTLDNKGKIAGDVDLNAAGQNDTIVNRGKIQGAVELGPGDDRFVFAGGRQGVVEGEAGADRFDFRSRLAPEKHAAEIAGFTPGTDTIGLSKKLFDGLGSKGALKTKKFEIGTKADDGQDRVIYNKNNGKLSIDEDGSGGAGQKLIARLDDDLGLTAGDFVVIA